MQLPKKMMRAIMVLPPDFTGSVILHHNGHGSYILEVKHQQRFVADRDGELMDFSADIFGDERTRLGKPRR